jgi:hypothetical protein
MFLLYETPRKPKLRKLNGGWLPGCGGSKDEQLLFNGHRGWFCKLKCPRDRWIVAMGCTAFQCITWHPTGQLKWLMHHFYILQTLPQFIKLNNCLYYLMIKSWELIF